MHHFFVITLPLFTVIMHYDYTHCQGLIIHHLFFSLSFYYTYFLPPQLPDNRAVQDAAPPFLALEGINIWFQCLPLCVWQTCVMFKSGFSVLWHIKAKQLGQKSNKQINILSTFSIFPPPPALRCCR